MRQESRHRTRATKTHVGNDAMLFQPPRPAVRAYGAAADRVEESMSDSSDADAAPVTCFVPAAVYGADAAEEGPAGAAPTAAGTSADPSQADASASAFADAKGGIVLLWGKLYDVFSALRDGKGKSAKNPFRTFIITDAIPDFSAPNKHTGCTAQEARACLAKCTHVHTDATGTRAVAPVCRAALQALLCGVPDKAYVLVARDIKPGKTSKHGAKRPSGIAELAHHTKGVNFNTVFKLGSDQCACVNKMSGQQGKATHAYGPSSKANVRPTAFTGAEHIDPLVDFIQKQADASAKAQKIDKQDPAKFMLAAVGDWRDKGAQKTLDQVKEKLTERFMEDTTAWQAVVNVISPQDEAYYGALNAARLIYDGGKAAQNIMCNYVSIEGLPTSTYVAGSQYMSDNIAVTTPSTHVSSTAPSINFHHLAFESDESQQTLSGDDIARVSHLSAAVAAAFASCPLAENNPHYT